MAILFLLLGHISYGITNALWKNPRDKIGTLRLIQIRSFCCLSIFLLIYFLQKQLGIQEENLFSAGDVLKAIGICAVNYFGLFFYLKSLKHIQVSNSIGIGKIGLIVGIFIGFFFYGEQISMSKILVCLLILFAVILIESQQKNKNQSKKGILYIVLSRLFWSTGFLFIPHIEKLGAILFCAVLEFVVFVLSSSLSLATNENIKPQFSKKVNLEIFFLVILGTVGTLSLNYGIVKTGAVVFAFVGLVEPVIGLLVSKFYHKEKFTKWQFVGICLALSAAFLAVIIK